MVKYRFLPLFIVFFFLLFIVSSNTISASQAGVGVVNVPPKYGKLRILQHEGTIRVYIIVSDYNSWGDIFEISVTLEDKNSGQDFAKFVYKQYSSKDSFEKVDWFNETVSNDLLIREKCSFETSDKKNSIDDRCDIELLFVFKTTWFSRLKIVVKDREGDQSTSEIDYYPYEGTPDETYRSENIIIIPWFDGEITLIIPSYLSNLLAVLAGLLGAGLCFRKRYVLHKRKFDYEKG